MSSSQGTNSDDDIGPQAEPEPSHPTEIDFSEITSQLEVISVQLNSNLEAIIESESQSDLAFREGTKGIENAIDQASTFPLGTTLLVAILGSVFAAIAAYVINYLHWSRAKEAEKTENLTKAIIQTVERLELFAIDYWLQPYDQSKVMELETLEINIKSTHASIMSHSSVFQKNRGTQTTSKSLEKFVDEIFDIATGGDFESTSRTASKSTATKISKSCETLKINLLSELFN